MNAMERWAAGNDDVSINDDGSVSTDGSGGGSSDSGGSSSSDDGGYSGGTVTTQETEAGVQRVNEVDASNGLTAMEKWMQDNQDVTVVNDSSDYYDTTPGDDPTDMGETNAYDLVNDDTQPSEDNDGDADVVVTSDPEPTVPLDQQGNSQEDESDADPEPNPEVTFGGDTRESIEEDAEAFADEMVGMLPDDPDDWLGSGVSDSQATQMAQTAMDRAGDIEAELTRSFEALAAHADPDQQATSDGASPWLAGGLLLAVGTLGYVSLGGS